MRLDSFPIRIPTLTGTRQTTLFRHRVLEASCPGDVGDLVHSRVFSEYIQ